MTGRKAPFFAGAITGGTPGSVERPLEPVRLYTATMAAWEMTKEALRKVCRDNNG